MKKLLLSLIFLAGCGTLKTVTFYEDLNELIDFRNEMSVEFEKGFAEGYVELEGNEFGKRSLRQAFVQFSIIMDEIDACLHAAPRLRDKIGDAKALHCAKASIVQALMFIKSLGVEPTEETLEGVPLQSTLK